MKKPAIIFVLGEAASGKTTRARNIASNLGLPLFSKDDLKVVIFDNLGWKDRQWSQEVGRASIELLDYIVEQNLKAGNTIVIESIFHPKWANPKFQAWQQTYGFNAVQVFCYADDAVLIGRFKERSQRDTRHVSHAEGVEGLRSLEERLEQKLSVPLELEGDVIRVDTTDFSKVDDTAIAAQVKAALQR